MTDTVALPSLASPIAPPSAPPDADRAALRAAAEEFEAMVLKELLQPMFEGMDMDALGRGGMAEQMFQPMMVDAYAKGMAARGGVGLADAVLGALVEAQSRRAADAADA